jgi:hypothetical protein
VKINEPVAAAVFDLPDEVRQLAEKKSAGTL